MTKGLFVIGTNTDIGKTYISGLIVKALKQQGINIGYYKPVLSGAVNTENGLMPGDVKEVYEIGGLSGNFNEAVTYMFEPPVSPHLASDMLKEPIDLHAILNDFNNYKQQYDYILVEGCGGLICPITINDNRLVLLEDIIKLLELETILVTDAGLGTINHTLLTTYYAEQKNIVINGIIINNYDNSNLIHQNNKKVIEDLTGIKVVTCIPKITEEEKKNYSIDSLALRKCFHKLGDEN